VTPTREEPKSSSGVRGTRRGWVSPHPRLRKLRKGKVKMELYINNSWTEICASGYVAEAIAWSENGNHATIYAVGSTADEADTNLMNALRELTLTPEIFVRGDACSLTDSESPSNASGGDESETDK
jgi:hypothetical protein